MKLSEAAANLSIIKAHCGISGEDSDELLNVYSDAAKKLVQDYTGLTAEQLDELTDVTVAFLNMVNEMYSQRMMMTSGTQMNEFQKQILDMHSVNYL